MYKNNYYLYVLLIILIPLVVAVHIQFLDVRYKERKTVDGCPWCEERHGQPDVIYIPLTASMVRFFSPADPQLLADLLWLRTTYYFGEHVLTDRKYPYLLHLLDLITDLAPKWIIPYLFGAVILPIESQSVNEGIYIIDKGIDHHPDNWRLWFFKGYYLWEHYNDYEQASKALYKASTLPGAPYYLPALAATFATRAGKKELALHFLEQTLLQVQDPNQRKLIIEKMKEVMERDDTNGNSVE